jgi:hypothetical protein
MNSIVAGIYFYLFNLDMAAGYLYHLFRKCILEKMLGGHNFTSKIRKVRYISEKHPMHANPRKTVFWILLSLYFGWIAKILTHLS